MSKSDVLKTIKDEEVDYVDIRFTDPRGKLQHVTVMQDQVDEDFLEAGFMFDGSSLAGWPSAARTTGHEERQEQHDRDRGEGGHRHR